MPLRFALDRDKHEIVVELQSQYSVFLLDIVAAAFVAKRQFPDAGVHRKTGCTVSGPIAGNRHSHQGNCDGGCGRAGGVALVDRAGWSVLCPVLTEAPSLSHR